MSVRALPAGTELSDLGRVSDRRGRVLRVERLGGDMFELIVEVAELALAARPGEFAQLRCGEGPVPLLRRPMSIAWCGAGAVSFVVAAVGVGTRLLAGLRPGDELDILGPLGRGFTIPVGARRVLCVAGGLGCAPFPLAAAAALRSGAEWVVVLHGSATADRLYPAERFQRGDERIRVVEATDDGSRGHHGFVTELVRDQLRAGGFGAVWGCGPNPMLAALAAVLDGAPGRPDVCEVSMEAPMGCGFGSCLGCAIPVTRTSPDARGVDGELPEGASGAAGTARGREWALCCREGPVMDVAAVDWEALSTLPPAHMA